MQHALSGIRFDDGTSILSDAYVYTMPELPTHQTVLQWDSSNAPQRADPVWAEVSTLIGAALLIGAGAFFITLGLLL